MDKELINRLQKYNTPENFYKLCMFVSEAAGEGLSINECDAGELLFLDYFQKKMAMFLITLPMNQKNLQKPINYNFPIPPFHYN